jgi:hypothetical protein
MQDRSWRILRLGAHRGWRTAPSSGRPRNHACRSAIRSGRRASIDRSGPQRSKPHPLPLDHDEPALDGADPGKRLQDEVRCVIGALGDEPQQNDTRLAAKAMPNGQLAEVLVEGVDDPALGAGTPRHLDIGAAPCQLGDRHDIMAERPQRRDERAGDVLVG